MAAVMTSLGCAATTKVNTQAIDELQRGERHEARAAWWGYDATDATHALQSAIDSGAKRVVVENVGTPWIVEPIQLASNQELFFEEGVVVLAKRGSFRGKGDTLFTASLAENVRLSGEGATFRMWKQDYQSGSYEKAEWRNTLSILSCANVWVTGLTLAESGGDGIYLGVAKRGVTNRNVHIKDVVCESNHRQGISVISARNLLIEDCILRNTSGTAPQSGIDFEPNRAEEELVNCVMRNCVTQDNQGDGYQFHLKNLTQSSAPVSIRLENCRSVRDQRSGLNWTTRNEPTEGPTHGSAEFINCSFEENAGPSIVIGENAATDCQVRFVDCRFVDGAAERPDASPIVFRSNPANRQNIGGAVFAKCTLKDDVQRQPIAFLNAVDGLSLVDVTGTFTVVRQDAATTVELDPELLARWLGSD